MRVHRSRPRSLLMTDRRTGKVTRVSRTWKPPGYRQRRRVISAASTVLVIVAFIVGVWGTASIITDIMRPEISEEDQTTSMLDEIKAEASNFDDGDAQDLLIIKVNDELTKPEYCFLVRFEPSEERVYITDLLTSLRIGDRTLAGWFREYGAETMAEKLAGYLDCDRVHTVLITYKQIRLLINGYGGVEYRIPYPINYKSPDGDRNLNTSAGIRLYTGGETARLLNYPGWKGGEQEHRKMYCEVIAALISKQLSPDRADQLKGDYIKLVEGTVCDISRTDFQKVSAGMAYLASSNTGNLTMVVEIEKCALEDGDTGYDENELEMLRAVFGRRNADSD